MTDRAVCCRVIKCELAVSQGHVGREYGAYLLEGGVKKDAWIGLCASHIGLQGQSGQSRRGWQRLAGPHSPGRPYSSAGKSEDKPRSLRHILDGRGNQAGGVVNFDNGRRSGGCRSEQKR